MDYYTNVSSVIESDDFFSQLLTSTWSLEQEDKQQRPLTSYNQRPQNFGGVTQQFGQESKENSTITPSNRYYDERCSPIRKSIAYSPPRKDGYPYKETPGQSSQEMPLKNNNTLY